MSMWDPFQLAALPLSAYTPGQGDPKMEGEFETASGHPVYTLEMYLRGDAPYVTGATSRKNPSLQTVFRTIGDQQVPVRVTDYGPGVKGLDIATHNPKWATDFPYQGATDKLQPMIAASSPDPAAAAGIGGRPAPIDPGVLAQFAVRNYASAATPIAPATAAAGKTGMFDFLNDYYKAQGATQAGAGGAGAIGGILSAFGGSMQKQGQQGMQQAMEMLKRKPSAIAALLDQLAANPTMYLPKIG